ncbi:MAG: peroxidase family protein [Myxococcota bacterium]
MKLKLLAFAFVFSLFVVTTSVGAALDKDRRHSADEVSPARRVEPRSAHDGPPPDLPATGPGIRSIDGTGNHAEHPDRNATYTPLARLAPSDYADGATSMAGTDRPSARAVSNGVVAQGEDIPNPYGTSDYLWQWGQFLDHDLGLTEGVDPPEPAHIAVPAGDRWFDPDDTGAAVIPFNRSIHDEGAPRQQLNEITGWIDASNVYGSDAERAAALRTLDGTGRLATGPDDLLPDSDGTFPNATGGSSQVMFLAGDVRANEQVGLTAMHTLFVREHNRIADHLRDRNPELDGDAIYERARAWVGALLQIITYEEFLPALLGEDALPPYAGYDPDVDASLRNEFSTAAFRFGHSSLSPRFLRLTRRLRERSEGHLALRDAFFSPDILRSEGGIEPLLRGLAFQAHQRIDAYVVDDLRNFLFGAPGAGGFDLPALNIQRGRDHGLPSYNDTREAYGLERAADFAAITTDSAMQERLAATYDSVDDVDLWVGGLAEDPAPGSQLGPLFHTIVAQQFTVLRDGDAYWYEIALGAEDLKRVRGTRLSDVIRRNTKIGDELPRNVFRAKDATQYARKVRKSRSRRR